MYLRYFYFQQLAASRIRLICSIPLVGFYLHFDVFIIEMLLCFLYGRFLTFHCVFIIRQNATFRINGSRCISHIMETETPSLLSTIKAVVAQSRFPEKIVLDLSSFLFSSLFVQCNPLFRFFELSHSQKRQKIHK